MPRPTRRPWAIAGLALIACWGIPAGGIAPAAAQPAGEPEIVHQTEWLERTSESPNVYRTAFEACDPEGTFRLVLDNGVEGGGLVSSADVWLNGTAVIQERDLNQQVAQVVRPVTLDATNSLEVRLAGAPGGRIRVTVDGHMNCLSVRITAPAAGSVLREPATVVEGELRARGTAGLRLRVGLPVRDQTLDLFMPVEVHGRRFAAWVALAPGPIRFTAIVSDEAGRSAEDTVAVTFQPDPPELDRASRPDVSPTVGFAPLDVTFGGGAAADPDVTVLDLDADGDGRPDYGLADFARPPHKVTHTYRADGLYLASMVVHDKAGQSETARVPINVIPPPDLPAVWNAFRAALGRGDVEGASRLVAFEARDRYRRVFEDLRADLPAIGTALQTGTALVVRPEYGTLSATRIRGGQTEGFIVHFVRDADGVWRIASL